MTLQGQPVKIAVQISQTVPTGEYMTMMIFTRTTLNFMMMSRDIPTMTFMNEAITCGNALTAERLTTIAVKNANTAAAHRTSTTDG